MSIARRGSRQINVDGAPLRWSYRLAYCGSSTCSQDPPHVVISHESRQGMVIISYLDSDGAPVTPKMIAEIARRAMARGWQPGVGTGEMLVRRDE